MAPTSIDGTEITGATIDGQDVSEITVDGETVFTAIPDSVVDNFEEADLSEYSNTGGFSVTSNTPVSDGVYSLKLINDGQANRMISTSGLANYPERGDTFRFNVQIIDDTALPQTMFGVQDANNFYQISIDDRSDPGEFAFVKTIGGSRTRITTDSVSFSTGIWYLVEVEWTDPTITATLYDDSETQVAELTADDTDFTSGGVGFRGGQFNDDQAWDNFLTT